MPTGPIVQGEVEELLFRLGAQLEEGTEAYEKLAEERAVAEADYKERYWTALVRIVDSATGNGPRWTAAQKEARAGLMAKEEQRRFKLLEAREKAAQQSLITIRARMDSLRTVSANVRAMGG
tara:strand:+ start:289 stop:654 length:366 start_codon:yes stop_codon:yes gene_type:complete